MFIKLHAKMAVVGRAPPVRWVAALKPSCKKPAWGAAPKAYRHGYTGKVSPKVATAGGLLQCQGNAGIG
jgi:hypothetical protein